MNSPVRDTSLLDAFAKQKGMLTVDDTEEEPRLCLLQHHELVVAVEHCTAVRPSKVGSLRGTNEKYTSTFSNLDGAMRELVGEGSCLVRKKTVGECLATLLAERRGLMGTSKSAAPLPARPQSASATLRGGGASSATSDEHFPRIGSFEIAFSLVNRVTGNTYGPFEVHSKLQTRRWPLLEKLRQRVDAQLQLFLATDMRDHQFHQAKTKAGLATLTIAESPGAEGEGGEAEQLRQEEAAQPA